MVAPEETWWGGYLVCPLKDNSPPHRMVHTLAPVRQGQVTRMERTLGEEGHHLGLSSNNSNILT